MSLIISGGRNECVYIGNQKYIWRGKTMCPWEIEFFVWNENTFKIIMIIILLYAISEYICIRRHDIYTKKIEQKQLTYTWWTKKNYPNIALIVVEHTKSCYILASVYSNTPFQDQTNVMFWIIVLAPWGS